MDVLSASPDSKVKEVHMFIEVDKGGSPGSVQIVAGIINQVRPNWVSNTILVAVCRAVRTSMSSWPACSPSTCDSSGSLSAMMCSWRALVAPSACSHPAITKHCVQFTDTRGPAPACPVYGATAPARRALLWRPWMVSMGLSRTWIVFAHCDWQRTYGEWRLRCLPTLAERLSLLWQCTDRLSARP